jgi:hypothetical protein
MIHVWITGLGVWLEIIRTIQNFLVHKKLRGWGRRKVLLATTYKTMLTGTRVAVHRLKNATSTLYFNEIAN